MIYVDENLTFFCDFEFEIDAEHLEIFELRFLFFLELFTNDVTISIGNPYKQPPKIFV